MRFVYVLAFPLHRCLGIVRGLQECDMIASVTDLALHRT